MGPLSDGGGDAEDDALPDLDQSDLPGPSTSAARPPEKRARMVLVQYKYSSDSTLSFRIFFY